MKHIIALLPENEPGALSRAVGPVSARCYNIESPPVAPPEDGSFSAPSNDTHPHTTPPFPMAA